MQSQSSESVPLDCYDDAELIEQFQNGDTAAFDTLFKRISDFYFVNSHQSFWFSPNVGL
jgi:hypothetical protein